jgi:hypothetical protein
MKPDPLVQEVREARAAIAEEFGYDSARYIAWVREQTRLLKKNPPAPAAEKPRRSPKKKPVLA